MDHHYIYPFIVFLTSLLDNKARASFYIIHILTNNSTTIDCIDKINSIKEKFGKKFVEIKYYNLEGDFKGATTKNFPLTTYYRLSLPSKLPDIDKIIYTDIDSINLEDLSETYNIKLEDKMYFGALLDYKFMFREYQKFGIKTNKYVNSGFLLINLKAIRNDGIENKLREFISKHHLPSHDQTVINVVCYNNIQILSYKYSLFATDSFVELVQLNNQQDPIYRFNESELKRAFNEPTFFHYFGWHKPWKKYYFQFNRVYWWYYAKMSGFYLKIIEHYRFKLNDIEKLLKQIPRDGGLLRRNYKALI